jgi:peptidoglycan/LPS O-acetylase OafA/YrhL
MKVPKYIPQFDVLRGIAVLAVMLFHIAHNLRTQHLHDSLLWGWAGVDLFFVLSGFLITGILIDNKDKDKDGYFKNFYARRTLRIWPLYYAVIVAMLVAVPLIAPGMNAKLLGTERPTWAFPLFLQSIFVGSHVGGPLAVTWSLAIEEQFYLVWPLVVSLSRPLVLKRISLVILIASPVLRLVCSSLLPAFDYHENTFLRLDGLAMGAFLAVVVRHSTAIDIRRAVKCVAPLAIGLVAISAVFHWRWLMFSALSLAFGCIVASSVINDLKLSNRLLSYTGKISYGMYLLHLFAFDTLRSDALRARLPHSPVANDLCFAGIAFAGTYGIASISWFVLESPINALKKYFHSPQNNAVAGTGLSNAQTLKTVTASPTT